MVASSVKILRQTIGSARAARVFMQVERSEVARWTHAEQDSRLAGTARASTVDTGRTRDAAFPLVTGAPATRGKERAMLDRIGILGILGFLIFAAWFIGWIFLGFHDGLYHLLFPISVVLMLAQWVRRVAR